MSVTNGAGRIGTATKFTRSPELFEGAIVSAQRVQGFAVHKG